MDDSAFEIFDPNGALYAKFATTAANTHEVTMGDKVLYCVEGNSKTLKFSVTSPRGEPVALARVNSADYPGGDHFEIRTLPGSDTVLVTAVLATILLFTAVEHNP
jgi:hypothetical protein